MLWFSSRLKIERLYYEWANKNGVADTPMSLVAFMQRKGWLNEEKILEDIRKPDWAINVKVEE